MRRLAATAAGLGVAAAAWAGGEDVALVPLACGPAAPAAVADPLGRDGLSARECPLPDGGGALLIVSDDSVSWPVLATPAGRVSFEQAILDDPAMIGPGLPYARPERDAALFAPGPPARVLIEFSSTAPDTLARSSRWLAIDLGARAIVGAAAGPEAAAALP